MISKCVPNSANPVKMVNWHRAIHCKHHSNILIIIFIQAQQVITYIQCEIW